MAGQLAVIHPNDPRAQADLPPVNIEAEQCILGIVLYDNRAFSEVDGILQPRDFHEPFHQRAWKTIGDLIRVGRLAEPVILRDFFCIDPAFEALGGMGYLADLVDRAPPSANAPEYARAVRSMALRRDVIRIAQGIAQRARDEATADGADLMADMERELLAVRSGKSDLQLRTWRDVSAEIVYGLDRPDDRPLIQCGLDKIDNAVGGFERGDLVVIGARPSMGKSALAGCMALNVALQGLGVVELNGEMTTVQMGRRHLTDWAFRQYADEGPMYRDIKRKVLTDGQKQILRRVDEDLQHLPLAMLKRTGLTLGRMRAMLRRQKMLWEAAGIRMSMVVIDHVGLVRPDDLGRGRTEDQTLVSASLKEMAEELDVVMLALAQLNRKVEDRDDKRPQLSDLRDSGSWEQDADVVMGVYRDSYYARREREPKQQVALAEWIIRQSSPTVEAIMLKIREGEIATAKLWADIGRNAIRDDAPENSLF
jgi:replicative DNA helicase